MLFKLGLSRCCLVKIKNHLVLLLNNKISTYIQHNYDITHANILKLHIQFEELTIRNEQATANEG